MKSLSFLMLFIFSFCLSNNARASAITGSAVGTGYDGRNLSTCRSELTDGRINCVVSFSSYPEISIIVDTIESNNFFSVSGEISVNDYDAQASYQVRIKLPDHWNHLDLNVNHSSYRFPPTWMYIADGKNQVFPKGNATFENANFWNVYRERIELTPGQEHYVNLLAGISGSPVSERFTYEFSTTPEPSTASLFAAASLGVVSFAWKRRRGTTL